MATNQEQPTTEQITRDLDMACALDDADAVERLTIELLNHIDVMWRMRDYIRDAEFARFKANREDASRTLTREKIEAAEAKKLGEEATA